LFLDIGLMQNLCGLCSETLMVEDFIRVNASEVAEQFVGQELWAYSDPFKESANYFSSLLRD
jgi:hypothetical protein